VQLEDALVLETLLNRPDQRVPSRGNFEQDAPRLGTCALDVFRQVKSDRSHLVLGLAHELAGEVYFAHAPTVGPINDPLRAAPRPCDDEHESGRATVEGVSELEIPDLADLGLPGAFAGAGALGLYWTLGPSIKAVGNSFGQWTEYRMNNLLRIGEKVSARRESQVDLDDGSPRDVHPRLAADFIENSSWVDDDLHQEYFAGLIAVEKGQSDDGLFYSRVISGLTASQVRLHFLIYRAYEGSFAFIPAPHFNEGEESSR